MNKNPIRLIPYCCGAGGSTAGCELGPVDLCNRGLAEVLGTQGIDISWQEDPEQFYRQSPWGAAFHESLPPLGTDERRQGVSWHCTHLRDQVVSVIKAGARPVTIGGDHSMAAGSLAGLAQAHQAHGRIGVIWVDAHADINTPETSPSQAFHGMPVAAMLGMGHPDFAALGGAGKAVLRPEHVFYLGLRDVDQGEEEAIRRLGIHAFTKEDVDAMGIENAFSAALETVSAGTDHLCLSVDLDAFDPAQAPSVGTPVDNGFRREDLLPVLKRLVQSGDFDLIELAEYNPTLAGADQTYDLTCETLKALLS